VHIDAPKALETPKPDLSSVEMALTLLQAVKDVEWELLGTLLQSRAVESDNSHLHKSVRLVPYRPATMDKTF
jgi:hypothetical protein